MKKKSKITIIISIFSLLVISSFGQAKDTWSQSMRNLGSIISDLLPDIMSEKTFNDPKEQARILKNVKKLSSLSHGLAASDQMGIARPDSDPSLPFFLKQLEGLTTQATSELEKGNSSFARYLLQSVTSSCIGCHTRTKQGISRSGIKLDIDLSSLNRFEKADYLTATRQFDEALVEYLKIIGDKQVAKKQFPLWEKALQNSLAITVRYKGDPAITVDVLNKALALKDLPPSFVEMATSWKESAQDWSHEKPMEAVKAQTLKSKIAALFSAASVMQKRQVGRSAELIYLRISSLAHDLLRLAPTGRGASEALLYAGRAYNNLWVGPAFYMPEMYFEACIQTTPHSDVSASCYKEYKDLILGQYSGSAGVSLPEDISAKLKTLKLMAQ